MYKLKVKNIIVVLMVMVLIAPITVKASEPQYSGIISGASRKISEIQDVKFTTEVMWTNQKSDLYQEPNTDTEPVDYIDWNTDLEVTRINQEWYMVWFEDVNYYIMASCLSEDECSYTTTKIPKYSGFKSFMDYRTITQKNSPQYKLQQVANNEAHGIRGIDHRFCVAVGTGTGAEVGDYGELILSNNVSLPIIVSDIKANKHTDVGNLISIQANCCSEFIVDINSLNKNAKRDGTLSSAEELWDSPVVEIKIFDYNYFEK